MTRPIVGRVQTYASMIVVFGLLSHAPITLAQTQTAAANALCSLLPDVGQRPITSTAGASNWPWPICTGLYFPIAVPNLHDQYGLVISVSQLDVPATAKSAVRLAGGKAVNYGDGGLETPGDPSVSDQTTLGPGGHVYYMPGKALPSEVSSKYGAVFSCGSLWVSVYAFPSKIATARKAVAELDAALQTRGLCNAPEPEKVFAATPGSFEIGASACGDDGPGLRCVVSLVGSGVGREVDFTWSVDGRIQAGVTGKELTIGSLAKGKHVIKVRAIDKNTKQPSNVVEIEFVK